MSQKKCEKHSKDLVEMCLAEDCKQDLFLCSECKEAGSHKHSKTDIVRIEQVKGKLKSAWEPKESMIQPYFKKSVIFYDNLRKQITKLIDQDQKCVQAFLTKVKYHHLPYEANSQAYLEFMKEEYAQLDKASILKLVNEADSGLLNKNLEKQKQVANFLDLQLKKANDKVLTLKYVLLSKKLESELLVPNLSQQSKAANQNDFTKIYSLFNSRRMLIRSVNLIYRGSENEFSNKSFYNRCNGQGNCLVLVKTKNNKLIGGFTPLPLVHHDAEQLQQQVFETDKSKRSFIFSISNLKSFSIKDSSKSLMYRKDPYGPCFGQDLDIGQSIVTSNIGHSYEVPEGIAVDSLQAKVYLLETAKAEIKEFQVWQLSF